MLPSWLWVLTSVLANVLIMIIEFHYRTMVFSPQVFLRLVPLVVLMQLCLWYTWHQASSLMLAWAVFTAGNTVLRLVSSYVLVGEGVSVSTVLGVCCIMGGAVIIKVWG